MSKKSNYLNQLIIFSVHMSVQFELCVWNILFAGKDVVILQNLLLRSPFVKPIDTTGIYDNNTANAVASYQKGNHLRRYSNIPGGGGVLPDISLGGEVWPGPWTLTIFKTKIADFLPSLRQNSNFDTMFKTFNLKPYPV